MTPTFTDLDVCMRKSQVQGLSNGLLKTVLGLALTRICEALDNLYDFIHLLGGLFLHPRQMLLERRLGVHRYR